MLICSQGWQSQICDSAQEFLAQPRPFVPSVLFLAFSDSNGLKFKRESPENAWRRLDLLRLNSVFGKLPRNRLSVEVFVA